MKNFTRLTVLFLAGLLLIKTAKAQQESCPSWGPYVEGLNMGTAGNGEVMYSEIMADAACMQYNTYWSTLNFHLGPRGGYGGIQNKQGDIRNNIFSLWDLQDAQVPQCTTEYYVPGMNVEGFGGEGTGLHSDYDMNWTPGVWYATAIRRWSIGDGKTRIGFFMYNFSTQQWTHYITMVTPENNAFLEGNKVGGFLENWNSAASKATRCGYYRNFWIMNANNVWSKPTVYRASAGTGSWGTAAAFNNTAVKLTSCGTTPGPVTSQDFVLTQTGTKPATAIPADILTVNAGYLNNAATINWTIDASKSPQLSYTINIYNNSGMTGTPVATAQVTRPEKRSETIALATSLPAGTYYVALQVKDIFNQSSIVKSTSFNKSASGTTWYRIKNAYSNKYLGIENSSTANMAYIVQYSNNTSNNLQWQISAAGNASVLINRNSSKAIDLANSDQTSGVNPIQYSVHNGLNQQWNLVPVENNRYLIQSNMSNHFVLDNPGSSTTEGQRMIIYQLNGTAGTPNQQWILEPVTTTALTAAKNTASSNEEGTAEWLIIPNPATNTVQVKGLSGKNDWIMIRDESGNLSRRIRWSGSSVTIDVSGLRKGIYSMEYNGVTKQFSKL